MSRPVNISDTLTLIPSGYTGQTNLTVPTGNYVPENGYHDHTYTNSNQYYARWITQTNTTFYVYYTFYVSGIPAEATITSVSSIAKIYVSSTSRITNTNIQLYSGTTAKGSSASYGSTSQTNTVNINGGSSWTVAEVNNIRLRFGGTRTNQGGTYYVYFAGATLTINYSISGTEYAVSISNTSSATSNPSTTQYVFQGEEQIISFYNINSLNDVNITDNSNDIKNSLSFTQAGTYSQTAIPVNLDDYYGYAAPSNPDSGYADSSSTNYAQLNIRGGNAYMLYSFDEIDIPPIATNISVSCVAKVYITNTSTSITNKIAQLYSGETAKGNSTTIGTTQNGTVTLSGGSWTADELKNAKIRLSAQYTGTSNYYIRFYGATLTASYTIAEDVYTYTISNISADHSIVIADKSSESLYLKVNGQFVKCNKIYKKINNVWTEVTLDSLTTPGIYIKK